MFRTNLLITLRRLWKNKVFSGVNLLGLALSLATFLLILQYVVFEYSFNRMYRQSEQLFRVVAEENEEWQTFIPPGFGPAAVEALPAIRGMTRVAEYLGNGVLSRTDSAREGLLTFREDGTAFVDGDFLRLFDRPMLAGIPDLSQPRTMALSASLAEKYFPGEEAVGRQLRLDNQFGSLLYTITGVFADLPENSDLRFNVLLSFQTLASAENRNGNDWADPRSLENGFANTYLLLPDATLEPAVARQAEEMVRRLLPDSRVTIHLQPVAEMHLGASLGDPLPSFGNRRFVTFLFIITLLILGIAWVNYVNLSTAQALRRAREIGIRKVVGAKRGQLLRQQLVESFLLTLFGLMLALLIVESAQDAYNRLTGLPLSLEVLNRPSVWLGGALLIGLTTLAAGGYVAFVLTQFPPIRALQGVFSRSAGGLRLRQGLVVLQFSVSIAFIAGTVILFQQLRYMQRRDLGARLEQRLAIQGPDLGGEEKGRRVEAFLNRLSELPYLRKYCTSGGIPGTGYNFSADHIVPLNPRPGDEEKSYRMLMIDHRYLDTYGIGLAGGQNFTAAEVERGWGSDKVMVNETAARQLGLDPGAAAGQTVFWGENRREIIGVVRDYNHQSLHTPVEPIVFLPAVNSLYFTLVMDANNLRQRLSELRDLYGATFPGNPFNHFFVDEAFNQYYLSEQRTGWIFTAASLLAIAISCLGLFGLAVFSAEQRTKEIGIRKVLGASVSQIVALLSGDFLRPVLASLLLATPIAWYAMNRWLQSFPYRIDIAWWVFAGAGALALVIAFLTVSVQSLRAAWANPTQALRDE